MEKQVKLEIWADSLIVPRIRNKGSKIERITPIGEPDFDGKGDYQIENSRGKYTMELKAEEKDTENLFLESWSNKRTGREGWMETCTADYLVYIFQDTGRMFTVKFEYLKEFYQKNKHRYYEAEQQKTKQHNDSWGYLFPIFPTNRKVKTFKEENIYD